jgi:hypothetical protein
MLAIILFYIVHNSSSIAMTHRRPGVQAVVIYNLMGNKLLHANSKADYSYYFDPYHIHVHADANV